MIHILRAHVMLTDGAPISFAAAGYVFRVIIFRLTNIRFCGIMNTLSATQARPGRKFSRKRDPDYDHICSLAVNSDERAVTDHELMKLYSKRTNISCTNYEEES